MYEQMVEARPNDISETQTGSQEPSCLNRRIPWFWANGSPEVDTERKELFVRAVQNLSSSSNSQSYTLSHTLLRGMHWEDQFKMYTNQNQIPTFCDRVHLYSSG